MALKSPRSAWSRKENPTKLAKISSSQDLGPVSDMRVELCVIVSPSGLPPPCALSDVPTIVSLPRAVSTYWLWSCHKARSALWNLGLLQEIGAVTLFRRFIFSIDESFWLSACFQHNTYGMYGYYEHCELYYSSSNPTVCSISLIN